MTPEYTRLRWKETKKIEKKEIKYVNISILSLVCFLDPQGERLVTKIPMMND